MFNLIRILTVIFTIAGTAATALAGDFAEFRSLGFSKDGGVFAFEQFGIQDGSGFAYAERYFINTKTDSYIKGTPIKFRADDENLSLSTARKIVADKSRPIIDKYGIGDMPAVFNAFNPSTETSANAKSLSYHPFAYEPNPNTPYRLELETIDLAAPDDCKSFMDIVPGFKLSLTTQPDAKTIILYHDKKVPKSRNCPMDYRLGGVLTYNNFGQLSVHVALVLVKSFGFEGPDGRWIAIARQFN